MTVSDCTERELIARLQARLAPAPRWMSVGIGDDAAVVEPERNRLEVLTVDSLVDGVHFDRAFVPPEAIGHRALAVNLSDLAAMGAAPRLALLAMALPASLPLEDFDGIADGFCALAAEHRVHLAGGNLTRTPGPLTIDVTAVGTVKPRRALTRSGAHAGEELYVSGTIGSAFAALLTLKGAGTAVAHPVDRYLRPDPRVRLGAWLGRNRIASACIDLSDGLSDGVHRIAEASGVGIAVDADALPIADEARRVFDSRGLDPLDASIAGGDDYELLFTVKRRMRRALAAGVRQAGVTVTRIGVCTPDGRIVLRRAGVDTPMPASGYTHFGAAAPAASRE